VPGCQRRHPGCFALGVEATRLSLRMKKKVKYVSTCMHLGTSLTQKLSRSADYNRRTISQEACWLIGLGMSMGLPKPDMGYLDDSDGRIQVYMEPDLKARVSSWAKEFGPAGRGHISPVVRALIRVGFAVQGRMMRCSGCSEMWPKVRSGSDSN